MNLANTKRMERLVPILLGMLVLLAAVPAQAGEPAEITRTADAIIQLRPRRGVVPYVGIIVQETTSVTGKKAAYLLYKGFCPRTANSQEECSVISRGFHSGSLAPDEYWISPALDSARVKFTRGGKAQEMTWRSTTSSQPRAFQPYCNTGDPSVAVVAGFNADAHGSILGKSGKTSAAVIEGAAGASTCDYRSVYTLADQRTSPSGDFVSSSRSYRGG